jgi:phosphoribosylformylglycinamidine synthase I
MKKTIAVVQFPGSNCENESVFALKRVGVPCEPFLWNESTERLRDYGGYFIVGGFSYEDRSRAGVIASLDPVVQTIREEALKGKAVLGICNGAQVLVESGLVPGYASLGIGMVLAPNRMEKDGKLVGSGYYNEYCHLKTGLEKGRNAFNRFLEPEELMRIPFAHAEGRFIFRDRLEESLNTNGMIAFRYCDQGGQSVASFPINPNGSAGNAAAVTNRSGNVMAMMPHPERTPAGDAIFKSMGAYVADFDGSSFVAESLPDPKPLEGNPLEQTFELDPSVLNLPVKLIITDNTAVSVEDALVHKGFDVAVERWVFWSVGSDRAINKRDEEALIESGELLNTNKEYIDSFESLGSGESDAVTWVVDSPVDPSGAVRLQTLRDRFGMEHLNNIQRRIIWRLTPRGESIDWNALMHTHIIHNPVTDILSVLK